MTTASPNGSADVAPPPDDRRRLVLDLEDLRFENARLRADLARARAQIETLAERNRILQHRFDRLLRLAPRGSLRLAGNLWRKLRPR